LASSETTIPVVLMGLGEIGQAIARAALARPEEIEIVGAVDPEHAGRPLAELVAGAPPELFVSDASREALARARGGVLLHATGSRFEEVLPELEAAVRAGVHVVSTCEELAYPGLDHETEAAALDRLCEERGVAVVGTGANPGFVLDRLPALLAQATGEVRHVRGVRVVDAARRRVGLQRKVGAGLSLEAFEEAAERGDVGHVGLAHSAALVAESCLGLAEYEVDEELEPLVADEDAPDGPVPVRRGEVAGVHQVARVFADDREVVRLELTLAVGAEDPRDELTLDADPPIRVSIPGGIDGDAATAHLVLNAVAAVRERTGLLTVLDLPAGR
jgi:4-hydroxy-tetrahydrodipicolinate reductase